MRPLRQHGANPQAANAAPTPAPFKITPSTPALRETEHPMSMESQHWKRNMYVCLFGSFTNMIAMTLLLPFLPIYVEQLGVKGNAAIVQWSGIAFGISFLGAGIMAPVWGRFADLYGRKLILMRASLAKAIAMSLIGVAENSSPCACLPACSAAIPPAPWCWWPRKPRRTAPAGPLAPSPPACSPAPCSAPSSAAYCPA
jgi:hypothetical protein